MLFEEKEERSSAKTVHFDAVYGFIKVTFEFMHLPQQTKPLQNNLPRFCKINNFIKIKFK